MRVSEVIARRTRQIRTRINLTTDIRPANLWYADTTFHNMFFLKYRELNAIRGAIREDKPNVQVGS
jgi:hypothetical protein